MRGKMRNVCRVVVAGIVALAVSAAFRVEAMKPLSNQDLNGVTGMSGVSIYFKDIDATLLQVDDFELDLTPSNSHDATFWIRDDQYKKYLSYQTLGQDLNSHAMAFCGSFKDEGKYIDVDFLGFDIDVGRFDTAQNGLNADAVTLSLTGYGSTAMFWNWDLCQFVLPAWTVRPLTTADVFSLRLGELFWAEKYVDPNKHKFMYALLSPLSAYATSVFVDSNTAAWHNATKADIRGYTGIGGELGLRPGGGSLGFFGMVKSGSVWGTGVQEATANDVMFAGDIVDKGAAGVTYPNWKYFNKDYYYSDKIDDWNIMGELVVGVHHRRTYNRSGYYGSWANGNTLTMDNYAAQQIGHSSDTRPLRIEVATSDQGDTYLVAYLNGHYSRTVYYPDSSVSTMRTSYGGCVPSTPVRKDYIIGELRVGRFKEANPDRDFDGAPDYIGTYRAGTPMAEYYPDGARHTGAWAINDISVEYQKAVIPCNRSLNYEISGASEGYLIPNLDYGGNIETIDGNGNVSGYTNVAPAGFSFRGGRDPADCRNSVMNIATPYPGTAGGIQGNWGLDIPVPGSAWK